MILAIALGLLTLLTGTRLTWRRFLQEEIEQRRDKDYARARMQQSGYSVEEEV